MVVARWNCTLSGTPLVPELDRSEQEAGLPQIFTPWSDNETLLMYTLFPNPDSLCLNFGRTGVFQWNYPNSSVTTHTTEWPQQVVGHYLRTCEMAGPTQSRVEPHPHMAYAIFRHMGPHFDSYANSGIPDIIGTELEMFSEIEQRSQLLYLLPHLQLIDVGTNMEHRLGDLQTLAKTILSKTGKRPRSHPDHPTTCRSPTLTTDSLRQGKQQSSFTAECVIHILCNTDLAYWLTDRGYKVPGLDHLGCPYGVSPLGQPMFLNGSPIGTEWEHLDSSERWGNWFESITRVCKSWHKVTQRRRSNPSFIAVCDYLCGARGGLTSETRLSREIKTSHKTYTQLQSICVGNGAINTKTQAHELINTLCDLTPTLKRLSLPGTNTATGLRAAKSLAIRGLALRDSMELVTWLHGLPVTNAKGFLDLMRDSPRITVLHVLEGCEQIALLNLVTQGYLPDTPLRDFLGDTLSDTNRSLSFWCLTEISSQD